MTYLELVWSLSDTTLLLLLLLILYGAIKQWWVWGWVHQEKVHSLTTQPVVYGGSPKPTAPELPPIRYRMDQCQYCGTVNGVEDQYCAGCGSPNPWYEVLTPKPAHHTKTEEYILDKVFTRPDLIYQLRDMFGNSFQEEVVRNNAMLEQYRGGGLLVPINDQYIHYSELLTHNPRQQAKITDLYSGSPVPEGLPVPPFPPPHPA